MGFLGLGLLHDEVEETHGPRDTIEHWTFCELQQTVFN